MGVMGRAHARSLEIVLILSATAAAVSAQPVFRVPPIAPVSVALTIDEAVTEALDHNLTLVAERYALAVADARILTAQLRPNPVLTSNVMLPDHTTFTNNISPREQVLRTDVVIERGGKRDRRIEGGPERPLGRRTAVSEHDAHRRARRGERLRRRGVRETERDAGAPIARRVQRAGPGEY